MAWTDYKGKIATVVITVALALSIFTCVVIGSVEKTNYVGTDYDYLTDVSGLYSYDKEPQYISYDTPRNYTGYSEMEFPTYSNYAGEVYYYIDENSLADSDYIFWDSVQLNMDVEDVEDGTNYDFIFGDWGVIQFKSGEYGGTPFEVEAHFYDEDKTSMKTIRAINNQLEDYIMRVCCDKVEIWGAEDEHYVIPAKFTMFPSTLDVDIWNKNHTTTYYLNSDDPYRTDNHTVYATDDSVIGLPSSMPVSYIMYDNSYYYYNGEFQMDANPSIVDGVYVYDTPRLEGCYLYTPTLTVTATSGSTPTGATGISATTTNQTNNYLLASSSTIYSGSVAITSVIGQGGQITIPDNALYRTTVNNGYDYYIPDPSGISFPQLCTALSIPNTASEITLTFGIEKTLYHDSIQYFMGYAPNNTWDQTTVIAGNYGTYDYTKVGTMIPFNTTQLTFSYSKSSGLATINGNTYNASDLVFYFNTTGRQLPSSADDSPYYLTNLLHNTAWNLAYYGAVVNPITVSYTYSAPTYQYMVIKDGIKIDTDGDIVRWSNGYDNGGIDILFHADSSAGSYENTVRVGNDDITITHESSSRTTVSINDGDAKYVGNWNSYIISIDFLTGKIKCVPVVTFTSFIQYTPYADYTYDLGTIGSNNVRQYVDYLPTVNSWGISVVNTTVFLNTYDTVMNNPSLDVSTYFTDMDEYRLNLYSFALYGTSLTINGTTYTGADGQPIRDSASIFIGGKSHTLSNIYITYRDDKTFITFADEGETIDLGDTVDTVISGAGNWYFTTALYEGHDVLRTEYNYDASNITIDIPLIAMTFLILTVIGLLLVKRFGEESLTAKDYLLIGGVIVLSLVLAMGLTL